MRNEFIFGSIFISVATLTGAYFYFPVIFLFIIWLPLIILGVIDLNSKRHTIVSNYPLFGRFRYVMEELRPKIYQYFIESDTDGTPINRVSRNVVYQRAKKQLDTTPFGTQLDIYKPGYEWINHSITPLALDHLNPDDLRINVGGKDCSEPYSLSLLNISAMSYGSLSSHAILALNWGAKLGSFAHNTGEGGISPYHEEHDGDIIWQIGTGYFGCRTPSGEFCAKSFEKKARKPQVKMIELKVSQGAKPGHGGILPAEKNTPEIAKMRQVEPYTSVFSPGFHSVFSGVEGLVDFIKTLRHLSCGKPIGIKLCIGDPSEFNDLCVEMKKQNIFPDFLTIDGGEGGTGAAPPEFSNSIGMGLRDGLIIANDYLMLHGIRDEVRLIASGKIVTGFDMVKVLALGADACYSARAMMLALGCIQALECNKNKCPTGVATQRPDLYKGLNVEDKYVRVANYHQGTLESVAEILCAAGISNIENLNRKHIWRRISFNEIKNYEELFPYPESLLKSVL